MFTDAIGGVLFGSHYKRHCFRVIDLLVFVMKKNYFYCTVLNENSCSVEVNYSL